MQVGNMTFYTLGNSPKSKADDIEQNAEDEARILYQYGYRGPFHELGIHIYVTFILGTLCLLAQLGVFIWSHESVLVAGLVMPIFLFTLFPLIFMMLYPYHDAVQCSHLGSRILEKVSGRSG